MRKQFVRTVERILKEDPRSALLLGDIGVFGFRNAFKEYPERVFNIGILEQATISMAAGLAQTGLIPIAHTIAPFLVERALEQLKIDFGYQRLGGNFVSVGASYEYAALGCTHHCPADVAVLRSIPGMEIVVPGTPGEFDSLFRQCYANGNPTYFRLAERQNPCGHDVKFGEAVVIQTGTRATIIAVGPTLGTMQTAVAGLDFTLLYYSTVCPFDGDTLRRNCPSGRIVLCEPYYRGGLTTDICLAMAPRAVALHFLGVPHEFLTHYGMKEEHDEAIGLTAGKAREELINFLNDKSN